MASNEVYWPSWARTWYGLFFRLLVAIWGVLAGLLLIAGGYYSAVNWKTGEENWTAGARWLMVAGVALGIYCIVGALRPSKSTFLLPATLFVGSTLWLIIAQIGSWARSL